MNILNDYEDLWIFLLSYYDEESWVFLLEKFLLDIKDLDLDFQKVLISLLKDNFFANPELSYEEIKEAFEQIKKAKKRN